VIVILASRHDPTAEGLVRRWARAQARLMTCEDLSRKGWNFLTRTPLESTAVIDRERVSVKQIRGVLVRLGFVTEDELPHIHEEDRSYVAAEMMAFLVAWLNELQCPVINRPTPFCLAGPSWRPEQWTHMATQLGIPIREVRRVVKLQRRRRHATDGGDETACASRTLTVVDNRCFGDATPAVKNQVRRLARAARVDLLSVDVTAPASGSELVQVQLMPPLETDEVLDAALACLRRSHRNSNLVGK
jgi:hypothetical protein